MKIMTDFVRLGSKVDVKKCRAQKVCDYKFGDYKKSLLEKK